MTPEGLGHVEIACASLAFAYCLGGVHGVALRLVQPWRMRRYAAGVAEALASQGPIAVRQVESRGTE